MRVVLVSTFFDLRVSYWEEVVAQALAPQTDLHVLTTNRPMPRFALGRPMDVAAQHAGINVHRLRISMYYRDRAWSPELFRSLDRLQPDALIVGTPSQAFPLPAVHWARARRIPYAYVSGEHEGQVRGGMARRQLVRLYNRSVRRSIIAYAAGGADRVIAITGDTRSMIRRATARDDVVLASLPVDDRVFRFERHVRVSTRAAESWEGCHVTVYTGKFDERKRLLDLIDAWRASQPGESGRLVLVGFMDTAACRKVAHGILERADPRVSYRPFLPQSGVARIFQAADVAVFPAATIGVQQALATGMTVVAPHRPELEHLHALCAPGAMISYGENAAALPEAFVEARQRAARPSVDRQQDAAAAKGLAVSQFLTALLGDGVPLSHSASTRWR